MAGACVPPHRELLVCDRPTPADLDLQLCRFVAGEPVSKEFAVYLGNNEPVRQGLEKLFPQEELVRLLTDALQGSEGRDT